MRSPVIYLKTDNAFDETFSSSLKSYQNLFSSNWDNKILLKTWTFPKQIKSDDKHDTNNNTTSNAGELLTKLDSVAFSEFHVVHVCVFFVMRGYDKISDTMTKIDMFQEVKHCKLQLCEYDPLFPQTYQIAPETMESSHLNISGNRSRIKLHSLSIFIDYFK